MDDIIEFALEILFALVGKKKRVDRMPDSLTYKDSFKIGKSKAEKVASVVMALLLPSALTVFYVIDSSLFENNFIPARLLVLAVSLIPVILSFTSSKVNPVYIEKRYFLFFKRTLHWSEVTGVRIDRDSSDGKVRAELFHGDEAVISFSSENVGFWYIVKMAEHKGIPVVYGYDREAE